LDWLVVRRQWAILQSAGDIQPGQSVGHHDERGATTVRIQTAWIFAPVGLVVWRLSTRKVRYVRPVPLLFLRVPRDVAFLLRPRPALWIGRGAVVKHPPIGGPAEAPVQVRAWTTGQ